jgi:hypothetical protein
MSEDIKKLKAKEYQARYYAKNKDKCLDMVKQWKANNQDKAKAINKTVYQNSKKKDSDGLSKYEKNLIRLNEKYKSDPEYREQYLAKQRAFRATEEYKLKKKKYNQTAKAKATMKKHNDLRKAARAVAAKEKAELKALLSPIEVKLPKAIKEPKQPKAAKRKATKKPKLVINIRKVESVKSMNVQIKVTDPTKPLSTKEIWMKKQNELREKIRSKERNHIDLKQVNKDPYANMTLTKSIKVKV